MFLGIVIALFLQLTSCVQYGYLNPRGKCICPSQMTASMNTRPLLHSRLQTMSSSIHPWNSSYHQNRSIPWYNYRNHSMSSWNHSIWNHNMSVGYSQYHNTSHSNRSALILVPLRPSASTSMLNSLPSLSRTLSPSPSQTMRIQSGPIDNSNASMFVNGSGAWLYSNHSLWVNNMTGNHSFWFNNTNGPHNRTHGPHFSYNRTGYGNFSYHNHSMRRSIHLPSIKYSTPSKMPKSKSKNRCLCTSQSSPIRPSIVPSKSSKNKPLPSSSVPMMNFTEHHTFTLINNKSGVMIPNAPMNLAIIGVSRGGIMVQNKGGNWNPLPKVLPTIISKSSYLRYLFEFETL